MNTQLSQRSLTSQRPLAADITIDHGPARLLGRYFLAAEADANALGVTLSFASMEELLAANRANGASWLPLISIFDPTQCDLGPDNSFCFFAHDRDGRLVSTQAGRFLDWRTTNLRAEVESLRLLYRDPAAQRSPGEDYTVSAPDADLMTGPILFSGAAWCRPDFRGAGLATILPRISRALGLARWNTAKTMTLMGELNMGRRVFARNGYRHVDWSVDMHNSPLFGSGRYALLWISRDELIDDIAEVLAGDQSGAEADRAARLGRNQ